MMTPDPMTPADCDLRGYDFMPLFGHHLFNSSFYAECSDEEYRAATRLWWSAWLQCPAASLPTGDNALALLAGYGRDLKGWAKVKARALHGFTLCSDGRLYHAFLSAEAVKSYDLRIKHDAKRAADRKRLNDWREARKNKVAEPSPKPDGNDNGNAGSDGDETYADTQDETRFLRASETQSETPIIARRQDRTGQDSKKVRTSLRSVAQAPKPEPTKIPDWMPVEAWNGFVAMRREIRKPLTERGMALLIVQLDGFRGRGVDVAAALNQSTISNYQGVFEPKRPDARSRYSPGPQGALEAMGLMPGDDFPDEPAQLRLHS